MTNNVFTALVGIANWYCGMPILYATAAVSLVLMIVTKGFVFRYAGHILRHITGRGEGKSKKTERGISSFSACCTALGNTIGVGNIAGVAVGIAFGGPGALFWIWIAGLLGVVIKYTEVTLGMKFRATDPKTGMYQGGIMWYIERGLGEKWKGLAILFALFYGFSDITVPAVQINSIVGTFDGVLKIPPIVIGLISAALMAFVLLGGIRRLCEMAERLVPAAAGLYFGVSIIILVSNASVLPEVLRDVVVSAFSGAAAAGGFAGATAMMALRYGIMRGFYSNGAATGDAAFAHSVAEVRHPVEQGMWGAAEVVIDTVACSCTALVILSTGTLETGLEGAALTTAAFSSFFGGQKAGALFVGLITTLFAFTTAVVCAYYGEICVKYLVKDPKALRTAIPLFRTTMCIFAVVGSVMPLSVLWTMNDYCLAICMTLCMLALLMNRKHVSALTKEYVAQYIKR